ncbi:hydroxyacid dehydrogenase [Antarcticirhabdus aurantiaca]|uniref:Hydroxyacid dehydrogenase n=1 Tax=Antarcticirhabdus aurantiaca TaxID=2606717 RepID=A0ACD4NXN3_9HYPH|nr:hydroxyacid dehydrogenase [Antarcticirhabdus aurantiaca]WAJ31597.1 hydroxyacid dehydrogenase [Jeongeuplla avenae]
MVEACQDEGRGETGAFTVLVTGAELVEEARALLADNGVRAVYANGYASPADLAALARAEAIDGLLVRQGRIDAGVIGASPRLKVIAKHGSGVDNIDLAAASALGIPVLRALAANAQSVAELAITLSVALMKDIRPLDAAVKGGTWPKTTYVGRDLGDAVFGIVGFGEIGRRAAALARGLGMRPLAYDPVAAPGTAADGTPVLGDLPELLRQADVVSLHCPLTDETRHLMNAERLALMKRNAFLVNTARGAVVDEAALVAALREGTIAGAGLDSFEEEPPRADHPLWSLPNVLATPHVAGASRSALRNMAVGSAGAIIGVLQGRGFDARACANEPRAAG